MCSPCKACRLVRTDRSRSPVGLPSRQGRAALVASALTRIAPVVNELERVWPSLRIPTSTIIDHYIQIAQGLTPKHVDWEVENPPEPPESLRDLVDSSVETFALATNAMPVVGSSDYKETLRAAEELVEALEPRGQFRNSK